MKAKTNCFPCALRQARAALKKTGVATDLQEQIMLKINAHFASKALTNSPARYSQDVYELVSKYTQVADPFAKEKIHFNQLALDMTPNCYEALKNSADPLETGAHLAVAGNIIDLGIETLDIEGTLANALKTPFARADLTYLKEQLSHAQTLLYLGDNAGEIVFDRLFIETIQKLYPQIKITFAVKSGPIINDGTLADAKMVGMDKVCRIIDVGAACIGVPEDLTSASFKDEFNQVDLIISKGQGNFETLASSTKDNIIFILKAKCDLVAEELGVNFGDSVMKHICSPTHTI